MAQHFTVHPDNPQARLLKQATALLERGGIVAVPTDSSYALACHLDDKAAADQLRRIRGVDEKHHLTLLCRDNVLNEKMGRAARATIEARYADEVAGQAFVDVWERLLAKEEKR